MASSRPFLDRVRQSRMRRYWTRKLKAGPVTPELQKDARKLRRILEDIERGGAEAEVRLSDPLKGLPQATLWATRPEPWGRPLLVNETSPVSSGTSIAPLVSIYHDDVGAEIFPRQSRAPTGSENPFELSLDIEQCDGSYASLALGLPSEEIERVTRSDLIRLDLSYTSHVPVNALARANIKIGPNVEVVTREVDRTRARPFVEFDLHYVDLEIQKITDVWVDVIFEKPGRNVITVHDLRLSRRPRAHS